MVDGTLWMGMLNVMSPKFLSGGDGKDKVWKPVMTATCDNCFNYYYMYGHGDMGGSGMWGKK